MSKSKKQNGMAKTLRPRRDKDFVRLPRFEGGGDALREFIDTNLVYPLEALREGIEGDVHVKYDVAETGEVVDVRVLRGIGGGCDEEAMRLIRMLKFTPVRNRGQRVITHFELILHFRLPVSSVNEPAAAILPAVQISYSFVPATQDLPIPVESGKETGDSAEPPASQSTHGTIVYTWTGRL